MNKIDFAIILGNIAHSLAPVQKLISGLGYLLGLLFIIQALLKLKQIGESRGGGSQESMSSVLIYLGIGGILLFLPSAVAVFSNTAFGVGNILQFSPVDPYNIYGSMELLIQTAGLLWFVRGCVLLVHAGDPGAETEGAKGITFLIAGILAMNFEGTTSVISYTFDQLFSLTQHSNTGQH